MSNSNLDDLKFGAHQFLWKSHWTDEDVEILDRAREVGCTLFEVSLGDDVFFDRAGLCRHAEALGIEHPRSVKYKRARKKQIPAISYQSGNARSSGFSPGLNLPKPNQPGLYSPA